MFITHIFMQCLLDLIAHGCYIIEALLHIHKNLILVTVEVSTWQSGTAVRIQVNQVLNAMMIK